MQISSKMNKPTTGEGKTILMKIETQLNLEVEYGGEERRRKQKTKEKENNRNINAE
ncbi:hypothetical protein Bca101_044031 [Brassica carinata]